MVEFKTYDESRLDDHIKLVNEVTKDWEWIPWYPNKEDLKEIYSREGFTPDTRHYAYDGDELVGFLSSAVEEEVEGIQFGSIHILFIKKGYEHIEEELMKRTIGVLQSKGVKAIRTASMPGWGNYSQILEKQGFGERTLLRYRTIFPTNKLIDPDYVKPSNNILDIDIERDKELLIEAIHTARSLPKEEIERTLDNFIANNTFIAGVIAQNDEILSYGLLYKGNAPERAVISMIPILKKGHEHLIGDVFKFLVHKAKDAGIQLLWHQMFDMELAEHYTELNLKFEPFYQYILRLS